MIRVMTYNLGGGRNIHANTYLESISILTQEVIAIINSVNPDLLFIQEVPEIITADGEKISVAHSIAEQCGFGSSFFFGMTLSMNNHLQVNKSIMRDGIFNDWLDWRQGNAIFSKTGSVRFSDTDRKGKPVNIPLFIPEVYQGNRDTDPRYAIFSRLNVPGFPYVVGVHLTTLLGERGELIIRGKSEAAVVMRMQQLQKVIDLLSDHVLAEAEPVILLGDLNAPAGEMSISGLLEQSNRFHRIQPEVDSPTHLKLVQAVDHILIYPIHRFAVDRCFVMDSPETCTASDHLPVIADLEVLPHAGQ